MLPKNEARAGFFATWFSTAAAFAGLGGCAVPRDEHARLGPPPEDIFIAHDRSAEHVCIGLRRTEELSCRAEKRLSGARTAGDSQAIACYTDRGRQIRAAARQAEESADPEHARTAARTIERVFSTLDDCERSAPVERTRVEVSAEIVADDPIPAPPRPY